MRTIVHGMAHHGVWQPTPPPCPPPLTCLLVQPHLQHADVVLVLGGQQQQVVRLDDVVLDLAVAVGLKVQVRVVAVCSKEGRADRHTCVMAAGAQRWWQGHMAQRQSRRHAVVRPDHLNLAVAQCIHVHV